MAQAIPFLIGAYAQYDLPNSADHNILKEKLLESGYNASTISVFGDNLSSLTNLLGIFGSDVKTILTDHYWDQSQSKVGIMGLTYGNYLKMEAEYTYFVNDYTGVFTPDLLTTTLDPTGMGDVYNYVFEHEANCGDRVGP